VKVDIQLLSLIMAGLEVAGIVLGVIPFLEAAIRPSFKKSNLERKLDAIADDVNRLSRLAEELFQPDSSVEQVAGAAAETQRLRLLLQDINERILGSLPTNPTRRASIRASLRKNMYSNEIQQCRALESQLSAASSFVKMKLFLLQTNGQIPTTNDSTSVNRPGSSISDADLEWDASTSEQSARISFDSTLERKQSPKSEMSTASQALDPFVEDLGSNTHIDLAQLQHHDAASDSKTGTPLSGPMVSTNIKRPRSSTLESNSLSLSEISLSTESDLGPSQSETTVIKQLLGSSVIERMSDSSKHRFKPSGSPDEQVYTQISQNRVLLNDEIDRLLAKCDNLKHLWASIAVVEETTLVKRTFSRDDFRVYFRSSSTSWAVIWKWFRYLFHLARPCHLILLGITFSSMLSLTLSLWWSFTRNDISGGFTLGAWILAVAAMPIGFASYRHNSECLCWKRLSQPETLQDPAELPT
jgi:hypothetical protein